MTTNREWLFSLPLEEQYAWMNAEHQDGTLDGDTAAQDGDSRDKLEADVRKIAEAYNMDTQRHGTERFAHELYYSIIHLLDRQAAITERKLDTEFEAACNSCAIKIDLREEVDKLTAERDKMQEQLNIGWECECRLQAERDELQAKVDELKELNEYHALQYELASEDCDRLQAQVDTLKSRHCPHYDATEHTCDVHETRIAELTAERDNWKEHSRTIEYRCKKAETDCEIYRKKFGKCLDYADAIHALMDEGLA